MMHKKIGMKIEVNFQRKWTWKRIKLIKECELGSIIEVLYIRFYAKKLVRWDDKNKGKKNKNSSKS